MTAKLNRRLAGALPWAVGESAFSILYGAGIVFLIGHLVSPGELGRAGIALSTVLLVELVTSAGLQDAVIQTRSSHTRATDTAYVMALSFALIGFCVSVALAYPISLIYGDPTLVPLICGAALVLISNALLVVPTAILSRKIRAGALTRRMLFGKLFGLLVLMGFGFMHFGSWAVVLSNLATSLGSLIMLAVSTNRWPRFHFSRHEARSLLRFGAGMSLENVLWGAMVRCFGLLFGYFHGVQSLGYFQFALRLVDETANLIQNLVTRFGLSFFSSLARSTADPVTPFVKGSRLISAVSTPVFILLALEAPGVIPTLFGARWLEAVPLIQVMAISFLFTFPRLLLGPFLRSRSKQGVMVQTAAISSFLVLLSCVLTSGLPIIFGAVSWTFRQIYSLPWSVFAIRRYIGISFKDQLRQIAPPFLAGLGMLIIILVAQYAGSSLSPLANAIFSGLIGLAVYVGLTIKLDRESVQTGRSILRHLRERRLVKRSAD